MSNEDGDTASLEDQPLSFTDAAERVLREFGNGQPMHYRAIMDRALQLSWVKTAGKTPWDTLYASIIEEIRRVSGRGETPRFVRHGKGMISLSRDSEPELVSLIHAHNRKIRMELRDRLLQASPDAFERLIGELLVRLGFEVGVTKYSGDNGIDVRGTLIVGGVIRTRMAVQVKRWKHNVQAPVVQQVRGSLGAHDQGLIITTSDFSHGAREEAERSNAVPVALMNGDQLVGLLVQYGLGARSIELKPIELADLDTIDHGL